MKNTIENYDEFSNPDNEKVMKDKKELPKLYSDITENDLKNLLDNADLAQQEFEYTLGIHKNEIDKLQKENRELNDKILQWGLKIGDENYLKYFNLI